MKYGIITFAFLTLLLNEACSLNYQTIKHLDGSWYFQIGDNLAWAAKDYDDSEWDEVYVPSSWEDQGYMGYNGFAWYRKYFTFNTRNNYSTYYLVIENVDDVDEVYLNGQQIGFMGSFPPDYETAAGYHRVYPIPASLLEEENVLAVRIFDQVVDGGILSSVKIKTDNDEYYLDIDLSGEWKFNTGHQKEWRQESYDVSDWNTIHVPMVWEAQGYKGYDGKACYRKTVEISDDLAKKDLYLVLGRIDDLDKVYFNGELIGTVHETLDNRRYNRWSYNNESMAYAMNRAYEIPKKLLKEENTIVVMVYDKGRHGGIYQGPIGIMTRKNLQRTDFYKFPNRGPVNFFESVMFDVIF
jgi:hypothetical protein